MDKQYAVSQYFLPEFIGVDATINRLLQQLKAGRGCTIHRADGVTLHVSADAGPADRELPALWEPRPSVACWICGAQWPAGYAGFDHTGRVVVVVCDDCAANLAAMVVDRHLGTVGG